MVKYNYLNKGAAMSRFKHPQISLFFPTDRGLVLRSPKGEGGVGRKGCNFILAPSSRKNTLKYPPKSDDNVIVEISLLNF
ncbi:MAG: hypothetical protein A2664_00175 [Candidatus Taylorbacteria bacterium RIFCSPHIGHO2_01_FULL_46_22b]|uniref:Uncharacterized protein n=1 Tax=Candidatus Taylorbacteria bacterium RIFCSPHIGHO2_01_FULL_46_22b TaxID=1802301 RepID=A0A1G2M6F4_9BACT|nr:MAG: hypothetical protein A2664_00175 [Candidatus Taylorbacteria bacterium RIFCSPHIGHO2_01_FULL_46_22b]